MIEPLADLPDGVIGFRFSGHIGRDEYRKVLRPALMERVDSGGKIRLAIAIDAEFDRFEAGAVWEDLKFGFGPGLAHRSAFERMAMVPTRTGFATPSGSSGGWCRATSGCSR